MLVVPWKTCLFVSGVSCTHCKVFSHIIFVCAYSTIEYMLYSYDGKRRNLLQRRTLEISLAVRSSPWLTGRDVWWPTFQCDGSSSSVPLLLRRSEPFQEQTIFPRHHPSECNGTTSNHCKKLIYRLFFIMHSKMHFSTTKVLKILLHASVQCKLLSNWHTSSWSLESSSNLSTAHVYNS